jgi:hypothetical protein
MQPYFLPHIGYFQLIDSVDKFLLYNDVNYINRGWINRNRLLVNGKEHLFTIPLSRASQNKLIYEIELADDTWKAKLLRKVEQSYSKAPQYREVYSLLLRVLNASTQKLDDFIYNSIEIVSEFLSLKSTLGRTSDQYGNCDLKGAERILDICRQEKAKTYVNAVGGMSLYSRDMFAQHGVELLFLQPLSIKYPQWGQDFVPGLSIVDTLMFNDKNTVKRLLKEKKLL